MADLYKGNLTEGSITGTMLRFAFPLMLGNLLQQCYNVADTLIVGRVLGADALAAVGSSYALIVFVTSIFIGLCMGCSAVFSMQYGAREFDGLRRSIFSSMLIVGGVTLVLNVASLLWLTPVIRLLHTPPEVEPLARSYLFIVFLGMVPVCVYNFYAFLLRAVGNSVVPLCFLLVSVVLNIGLDLLFIIPFQMGVLGAALATDISQVVSGVLSFIYLSRKFDVLKMQKSDFAYSKKACARLLGIGIPMGLQCSITAIGSVIMQWAVNVLGSTAVAAVTAAGKTQSLLTVPMESVGTAMATYAGQNLGASRMDRVRQGVNSAMLIILIYGVASAFVLHFTDVQIMGLFLDTAKEVDIVAMGREYLFWNSVFFVPLGALIIWRYTIQGLGFSTLAMMAGVAEMVARTVVAIALVPVLGYFGAELSNPAAWIAACVFLYPAYIWTCHQLDNRLLAAKLHIQGDHAEPIL